MSSYTSESYGAAAPENHEIDLIRLLGEMIDHRAVILSITFIFTLLAGLYAFLATPVYRADALIQVEGKQDNSLLKNLKQFGSEMSPDVQPEILLLKSRMILGATVDELGLAQHVTQRTFPVVGALGTVAGPQTGDDRLWLAATATCQRQTTHACAHCAGKRRIPAGRRQFLC